MGQLMSKLALSNILSEDWLARVLVVRLYIGSKLYGYPFPVENTSFAHGWQPSSWMRPPFLRTRWSLCEVGVFQLDRWTVVKLKPFWESTRNELESLRFVADKCPSIPTPRPFFAIPFGGIGHLDNEVGGALVMSRVGGVPLSSIPVADLEAATSQRLCLMSQLGDAVNCLREARQLVHPGSISTVTGLGIPDHEISPTAFYRPGPFEHSSAFYDYLADTWPRWDHRRTQEEKAWERMSQTKSIKLGNITNARTLATLTRIRQVMGASAASRPVLTHGDLQPKNIMVDPRSLSLIALIDWETCGFWPEWWEYACARRAAREFEDYGNQSPLANPAAALQRFDDEEQACTELIALLQHSWLF